MAVLGNIHGAPPHNPAVIPAKAGIHGAGRKMSAQWAPAFAGVTPRNMAATRRVKAN